MDAQPGPIRLNSHVVVELVDSSGEAERREFTLVPTRQADFKSGLLDEKAPLGLALQNRHAGEVISYQVGDLKEVRILAVETMKETIPSDAAEKRRSDVQKAEAQSEITNQMIFSTASGSKWGDYDVDVEKLMKENEQREQEQKDQEKKEHD
jgi:Transcription elongation factor, GreA/GreB, C-term